jgi:imidazolonepropionase-like amidohydrolase
MTFKMKLISHASLHASLLVSVAALISAAPALADTIAITGGKVITVSGAVIEGGTVLIRDSRIAAVGKDVAVPKDAKVIDATGKTVTPGLIATDSGLGFVEVSSLGSEMGSGNAALSASFDVSYGYNRRSQLIPVARLGGLTRAIVLPETSGGGDGSHRDDGEVEDYTAGGGGAESKTHGLFGGLGAVIDLSGSSDTVYKSAVAEVADLGAGGAATAGGSRGSSLALFKAALADARHYAKNRAVYARGEGRDLSLSTADLEALIPVIEGRRPLVVYAESANDITKVLSLASDEKIRVIIRGAGEGWQVADKLAAANVTVVINAIEDLPEDFDMLTTRLDNAALLQKAGVHVIITGNEQSSHRAREARYNAGNAVANGLPYAEALKSLTFYPAQAFGLTDLGSLEAGKLADVVIWSGDPLEPLSQPEKVLINGKEQDLTSRPLMLRDRYMKASALPPAYTK